LGRSRCWTAARARILGAAAEEIRPLLRRDPQRESGGFRAHRPALSGLGFYIEGLAHARSISKPRCSRSRRLERGSRRRPTVTTVEAQVAEQQRETASLYEEWEDQNPKTESLRAELKKNLAALQKDAGLIADRGWKIPLGKRSRRSNKTSTMPLTPFLREAIEKITAGGSALAIS